MIWIKRLLPFVLIAAGYFGYLYYERQTANQAEVLAEKHAMPVALAWVASAKYRDEPQRYQRFRDSVLEAHGLDKQQLSDYFTLYSDRPAEYRRFAKRVTFLVDSLSRVQNRFLH